MSLDLAALDQQLEALGPEELPAAALALSARLAQIAARLGGVPMRRWSPASKVADASGLDVADLNRWAHRPGVTWATWPTKRALLVDVEAFDRWLAAGRFKREGARGRTKPRTTRVSSLTKAHEDERTAAETA